uniref:Uncharacterized protein LOC114347061 n=1 Tax=Diabrotica virgifera virgifera TaxID=50390 RepID=A0A6P7H4Y3_DIAVI
QDNCRAEIYCNKVDDALLDSLKTEIKEEPDRESTQDTFDDSDLNEYSLKIEIEENETKFMPYEEKQMNEKGTTIRRRTRTSIPKKRKQPQIIQPTDSVASVLERYLESTVAANANSGGNILRQFFIAMADTAQSFPPALQIEVSRRFSILYKKQN